MLARVFDTEYEDGVYTVYYDHEWKEAAADSGVYRMDVAVTDKDGMLDAEVSVKRGSDDVIYSINAKRYEGM